MADKLVSVNDDYDFPAPVAARQAARLGDATTAEGKVLAGAVGTAVDGLAAVDLTSLGVAASAASLASSRIVFEDSAEVVERWGSLSAWSPTKVQVSAGAVYGQATGSAGAYRAFPVTTGQSARIRGSITIPAAGTGNGLTLIGFSVVEPEPIENGWNVFGVGLSEKNVPTVYIGMNAAPAGGGSLGAAVPAGTYYVTIEVDAENISCTLTNADGSIERGKTIPRSSLVGSFRSLMVWNSDSRLLAGNSIGAIGARRGITTMSGAERTGIETSAPSVNYGKAGTEAVRIALPASYDARKPAPLVLFAHGSGGTELTPLESGRMLSVTTAMQNAGYIVASSNQHGNNWGNPDSVTDLLSLYRKVRDRYAIGSVILMGQSMGGLSSLLTLARREIPGVVGYVGIYPVTNLADMYSRSYAGAIRTAYGFTDTADYATKTAGHDPNLIPAGAFRGVPMRFYASPADTVVPKPANTDTFVAKFANMPAETVVVPCEGEHGHASHFLPADVVAFLDRCLMR